jgi:hypothetical protein
MAAPTVRVIPTSSASMQLTVFNDSPDTIVVTPWQGGRALSIGCAVSAPLLPTDSPQPPWEVTIRDATTRTVVFQQLINVGPAREIVVTSQGVAVNAGPPAQGPGPNC